MKGFGGHKQPRKEREKWLGSLNIAPGALETGAKRAAEPRGPEGGGTFPEAGPQSQNYAPAFLVQNDVDDGPFPAVEIDTQLARRPLEPTSRLPPQCTKARTSLPRGMRARMAKGMLAPRIPSPLAAKKSKPTLLRLSPTLQKQSSELKPPTISKTYWLSLPSQTAPFQAC